ncbi:ABC transporter permease [Mycetocola reblochoni]|uniref:Dipeptide transport system permease protein DppB (TC 3.A.1.5.2) n=2 Tax=Mycetocola reblochoni TaxID=331618 RepID=A0A1R4IV98_9MICO|nr:ABC transporter permease [Mycetocola reblochoni]RLP70998.1 ABC transporter permease [Mycetocola reblochoni]SJN23780.1 Dipeptide transport system permease protein DppB (TC 3.A.1.5.2) [Mycetocola reblochoni REB411]
MTRLVLGRLLRVVITLTAVVLITFLLTTVAYNDPARLIAPDNATEETLASIRATFGLDQPWWVQLWRYAVVGPPIQGVATGLLNVPPSLGYSYVSQRPVTDLILEKLPATASLALGAFVLWMLVAVVLGVLAARRPGGPLDRITSVIAYTTLSVPVFVVAVLLIFVLYFQLSLAGIHLFPSGGYVPFSESPGEWARHLILPWTALVLVQFGPFQRIVRSSVLEVTGKDYIRTATAKGLGPGRVYFDHALSGAANPILTLGGIELASLMGGAIVTEQIFGIDGIGRLAVRAASTGDAPVVIGVTLVGAVFFVLITTLVDLVTHARGGR